MERRRSDRRGTRRGGGVPLVTHHLCHRWHTRTVLFLLSCTSLNGVMVNPFDPSRLEPAPVNLLTGAEKRPPRHGPGEKFLKGPIPWRWLELASALPGKALVVGLAIWKEAGCRNERTVPLNLSNQRMPRRTAQRGLQALAGAELVSVEHRDGRPPLVTLLPTRERGPVTSQREPSARGCPHGSTRVVPAEGSLPRSETPARRRSSAP